jgi:hypothetical protein
MSIALAAYLAAFALGVFAAGVAFNWWLKRRHPPPDRTEIPFR